MIYVLVVAVIALAWYFLSRARAPAAPEARVRVDRAAHVLRALKESGGDRNFAVFVFAPQGADAGDSVNLQFSIEGGRPGVD